MIDTLHNTLLLKIKSCTCDFAYIESWHLVPSIFKVITCLAASHSKLLVANLIDDELIMVGLDYISFELSSMSVDAQYVLMDVYFTHLSITFSSLNW